VRRLAFIAVVLSLLVVNPALGQNTSRAAKREAKESLRKAQKLWKRGDWEQAETFFRRAEELHKEWKYPFAFAEVLYKRKSYKTAWWAMQRAAEYGLPPSQHTRFNRLNQRLELKLFESHSLLELVVVPTDASVRLQNRRWSPPFRRWVDRSSSVLVIEHPDFVPVRITWKHPKGDLVFKEVRLIPAADYGRINVTGGPEKAQVSINSARLGELPSATSRLLKPGSYSLTADKEGFVSHQSTQNVMAGKTTSVEIQLQTESTAIGRLMRSQKFWGWTAAGAGLVSTIIGAVMLSDAATLRDEADEINRNHSSGYEDYKDRFVAKTADIDGLSTGGGTAVTLGVVLIGAGAALLVLDYLKDDTGSARLQRKESQWDILPTFNGVHGVVRF